MNNSLKIVIFFFSFLFISCEKGEKFSGSPLDSQQIVTLNAALTTNVTSALTDQDVDVTVTLQNNVTFNDLVEVEVISEAKSGAKRKVKIDIISGQSSGSGKISVVGGSIYNTSFIMYVSAINLKTSIPGIHHFIKSNILNINSSVIRSPVTNPNYLIMRLYWPSPSAATKNLEFGILKPGNSISTKVLTLNAGGFKEHKINNDGILNNLDESSANGDYILSVRALSSLAVFPVDMPLKFVFGLPDGRVQSFDYTYLGLTPTSPVKQFLKINKSIVSGQAKYTITEI